MASTPGEPFLRAKVKPLKLKPRCSEFSRLGPKPENYASTGSRATGPIELEQNNKLASLYGSDDFSALRHCRAPCEHYQLLIVNIAP